MNVDLLTSNSIALALFWLQSVLLGPVATTIAVIAVASVGFLMLSGRIDIRRAAQVVVGCFIIFGASTIAQGIIGGSNSLGGQPLSAAQTTPPLIAPPPPAPTSLPPKVYDPYAGAAVPPQ